MALSESSSTRAKWKKDNESEWHLAGPDTVIQCCKSLVQAWKNVIIGIDLNTITLAATHQWKMCHEAWPPSGLRLHPLWPKCSPFLANGQGHLKKQGGCTTPLTLPFSYPGLTCCQSHCVCVCTLAWAFISACVESLLVSYLSHRRYFDVLI